MTQRKSLDGKRPRRSSGIRRERRVVDTGPRYEIGWLPLERRFLTFCGVCDCLMDTEPEYDAERKVAGHPECLNPPICGWQDWLRGALAGMAGGTLGRIAAADE